MRMLKDAAQRDYELAQINPEIAIYLFCKAPTIISIQQYQKRQIEEAINFIKKIKKMI
jgi:hypothetical protein